VGSTTKVAMAPRSSTDRRVERAAAAAVSGVREPTDVVVMRASTGEVLAYLARGGLLDRTDPLTGHYPTGSTYKLVTTLALLEHGATPTTPVRCPSSVTIGGVVITTFGGRRQSASTLAQAFAQSCNTAFATLGARLPNAAFADAATQLGLGAPSQIGPGAFTGSVVEPASAADRATFASDGGPTRVSPIALATLAATIDTGRLHRPTLVLTANPPRSSKLPTSAVAALQSMMAAVVQNGTASGAGLPPGTHAKTGTAEFHAGASARDVFAWLVGYRADVAFAVLVFGGSQGGTVAGPIAARLLDEIRKSDTSQRSCGLPPSSFPHAGAQTCVHGNATIPALWGSVRVDR
jgi:cell division protein FtsI/penicillin-binding protein 2